MKLHFHEYFIKGFQLHKFFVFIPFVHVCQKWAPLMEPILLAPTFCCPSIFALESWDTHPPWSRDENMGVQR